MSLPSTDPASNDELERETRPTIAWKWEETPYNPGWHDPTSDILARNIPQGSTVLEIGAGGSYALATVVSKNNCSGYGIELDEDGLKKTRAFADLKSVTLHLVQGDGFRLPFTENAFDVVYSQGLVEHFKEDLTRELLLEHHRVCKPGGLVIVSVPNLWNLPHTMRKMLLREKYEYYPERSYTSKRLRKLLEDSGLKVTGVDGVNPLWALGLFTGWWRVLVVLDRLRLLGRINHMKRSSWRANTGFMTYAIARK